MQLIEHVILALLCVALWIYGARISRLEDDLSNTQNALNEVMLNQKEEE